MTDNQPDIIKQIILSPKFSLLIHRARIFHPSKLIFPVNSISLKSHTYRMKSYLKSLTQSLYQKVERVVEDEYIQPMTESQIYTIINRKQPRLSSSNNKHAKSPFNSQSSSSQQILDNIERLTMFTPQRQFKLIGDTYSIEVINYRMKDLKNKIQAVKEHMISNYGTHLQAIQTAIIQIQTIHNLASTRLKSSLLRQKIQTLRNLVDKTIKITTLNIKLKNVKQTLKIAEKIPNIKKMQLFQLKNINLTQIYQFKSSINVLYPSSKDKALFCIQHLEQFIDKVSSQNLRVIIVDITSCISQNFINQKYQKVIRDFILSKSEIDYQKLVIRLVEGQVRDKVQDEASKSQDKNPLVFRCKKYIKILINLSKIFRWHRCNLSVVDASPQIEEKIRARNNSVTSNCSQKSQEKPQNYPVLSLDSQISIRIHTQQVKTHACQLMDQCLKEQLEEMLFNEGVKNQEIFEILALMNSFYQVAFSFSSFVFQESMYIIKQILMRKCYKLQQRGLNDLNEGLNKEQENQWNRLPLLKNYRFKSLQRTLQRIKKLHLYEKIPDLSSENFKFLNIEQSTSAQDIIQLLAVHQHQSLELQQVQFPYQKLQKASSYEMNNSPLPQHQDPQVVICKSSLIILSYFQQFLSMYFYFPIQEVRNVIMDKMLFYLDYYIYYTFHTFLSDTYKKIFFQDPNNLEQSYLQVRFRFLYQQVYQFILAFDQSHLKHHTLNQSSYSSSLDSTNTSKKVSIQMSKYKSTGHSFIKKQIKPSKVSPQNTIKARALSTDSIKFLIAYLSNIVNHLKKYTSKNLQPNKNNNQLSETSDLSKCISKIDSYKMIYNQLSDLLLNDSTLTSTNIDFVQPIMKKIKWHQIQNAKQISDYGSIILKSIKETYEKMKSMSKGEVPFYLVDKIFSFYWKTQLTFITKLFLEQHVTTRQKGGRNAKITFEKLIDTLYEGLIQFMETKPKSNRELSSLTNSTRNFSSEYTTQRLQLLKGIYLKIKSIFPILYEKNWQHCQSMVKESLKNFEFIYKIQIFIIKSSESCCGLSQTEIEQRIEEIDDFINSKIIKQSIY